MRFSSVPLALLVVALATMPAHAQGLRGEWCGRASQTGPGDFEAEWSATMALDGPTGQMDYPSLGCGGTLVLERSDGAMHYYRERLTYGRDVCIDDGVIAVTPDGTSLRWRWEGSGAVAAAILTPMCRLQSRLRSPAPLG